MLPSGNSTSSSFAPASGEPGIFLARLQQLLAHLLGGREDRVRTEAAVQEPPSTGDCGSVELPSLIVTFSSGRPSISAATWVMIV